MSRNSMAGLQLQRSIVIGSYTSDIKTPSQLTTLNIMGALSDLCEISMEICHGKFTKGNLGHTH